MSLLESNPTRATLTVHVQSLRGLHEGLTQAVGKLDRVIATPRSTDEDIQRATREAVAAVKHVTAKIGAMDCIAGAAVATGILADRDTFRPLGEVCAGVVARIEQMHRDHGVGPCADAIDFPTRQRIEHGGPRDDGPPRSAA